MDTSGLVFVSDEDMPSRAPGAGRPAIIDPLVDAYKANVAAGKSGNLKITGMVSANSLASFRLRHTDVRFFKLSGDIFIGPLKPKVAKKAAKKVTAATPRARRTGTRSSRSSATA